MKVRITIARLLLFVSIVMLTASVFPHHHHRDLLCLQKNTASELVNCGMGNNDCCTHNHSEDDASCQGDNTPFECTAHCVTNFSCSEPEVSSDSMEPYYTFESVLFNLIYLCELSCCYDKNSENSAFYYNEGLYYRYFGESFGLRAPPAC